ncbi:MAG: response regulator, partial [Massilimaliae sp.]|nr:response regulator [Massiliimalia sp.]
MYQVFLVDDEFLAIEGLRLLVDWERLGAEVCGAAYDGISAREQILEKKPDIVLTDIRMPGMNGLDLIAAVKQALPSTVFVVISGYNEFEYA